MTETIVERLEAMLAQGQDSHLLRFGLASAYFNQKSYRNALVHLTRCVEQEPAHSAAWKLLGRSYQALGQRADAVNAFEQGLKVAQANGDKQVEREITVFLKKLTKQA